MAQEGFIKGDKNKGVIGSRISNWVYNQDYLVKLNDLSIRANEYDRMALSDPVIRGLMRAVKNPILSASWGINYENEEIVIDKDKQKIIDYGYQVFFDDLNLIGYKLEEILLYLRHGYSVFAKILTKKNNRMFGDYISIKLPIRMNNTIKYLRFYDQKDPDRLTHITQQIYTSKYQVDVDMPTEKLLIFTLEKTGNDITGQSLLRGCYKPFTQKDFIEKMQMIGIEKEALGTIFLSLPQSYSPDDLDTAKDSMDSYMGHEKLGMFEPDGFKFRIEKATFNSETFINTINQKNTEMAIQFLAQFLLLGQFEKGGAYALGQDQSDFFLNSLEYFTFNIIGKLNEIYKYLIDLQFGEQEVYPTFYAKGINNKASKELSETLKNLVEAGLIYPDKRLSSFIRETYKLPNEENEENISEKQSPEKDSQEEKDIPYEDDNDQKEMSDIKLQSSNMETVRYKENIFLKHITETENWIEEMYNTQYETETEKLDRKIKEILESGYNKAKTTMRGGVEYLTNKGNRGIINDMKSKVRDQFQKFKNRTASKTQMNKLMRGSLKRAEKTNSDYYSVKNISLAAVSEGQYNSFVAGHRSNMFAVVDNEERRVLERIENNFGSELSLEVIQDQISLFKINRNTYKLSVTAHPRGMFRQEVSKAAENRGITTFKMLVPKGTTLKKAGATIGYVYMLKTLLEWEEKASDKQDGSGVVGGLGLHHNSKDYYEPISDADLEAQRKLSREQRSDLENNEFIEIE